MFKQDEIVDFNSYKNAVKKLKIKHAIISTGTIVLSLVGVIYTYQLMDLEFQKLFNPHLKLFIIGYVVAIVAACFSYYDYKKNKLNLAVLSTPELVFYWIEKKRIPVNQVMLELKKEIDSNFVLTMTSYECEFIEFEAKFNLKNRNTIVRPAINNENQMIVFEQTQLSDPRFKILIKEIELRSKNSHIIELLDYYPIEKARLVLYLEEHAKKIIGLHELVF